MDVAPMARRQGTLLTLGGARSRPTTEEEEKETILLLSPLIIKCI